MVSYVTSKTPDGTMPPMGYPGIPGILPQAANLYQYGTPQYYPGQTVAGFNPLQYQGWDMGLAGYDAAQQAAQQNAGIGMRAGQQFMNILNQSPGNISAGFTPGNINAGDIGSEYLSMLTPDEINSIQGNFQVNPYINDQVDAYQQAFTRGFERSLPQYDVEAMLAGQMGSSRHGIERGLARSDFQRQLSEGTSGLLNLAWRQAAENQLQSRGQTLQSLAQDRSRGTQAAIQQAGNRTNLEGINTRLQNEIAMANARNELGAYQSQMGALSTMPSMLSTVTGLNMAPSTASLARANYMTGIGNAHQTLAQRQISGEMDRWNFEQMQPWDQLNRYANVLATAPNMGQGPTFTPQNPLSSAVGGIGAGINIGRSLGNLINQNTNPYPMPGTGNPWMPGGAYSYLGGPWYDPMSY